MSDNKNQNQQVEELDINHLMQVRREKLKELQEQGKDPYEITKFNSKRPAQSSHRLNKTIANSYNAVCNWLTEYKNVSFDRKERACGS